MRSRSRRAPKFFAHASHRTRPHADPSKSGLEQGCVVAATVVIVSSNCYLQEKPGRSRSGRREMARMRPTPA